MGTSSADKMVKILLKNPDKWEAVKKDPSAELPKVAAEANAQIPSTPVYRTIVGALATVAIAALVGAMVLVALGKTAPDVVVALGSAAIGALAGTLVPQKQ